MCSYSDFKVQKNVAKWLVNAEEIQKISKLNSLSKFKI